MIDDALQAIFEEGNKAEKKLNNSSGGGVNYFNAEDGKNKFRVFAINGRDSFLRIAKHYGFKDDEGRNRSLTCTIEDYDKCPMCEQYVIAKDAQDSQAWRKKRKISYYMYAINEENTAGVLQMDERCFVSFKNLIKDVLEDEDLGSRNIVSLDKGSSIIITKSYRTQGTIKIPEYTCQATQKVSSFTKEEFDKLFKDIPKLPELHRKNTPEEINMALEGDYSFMKRDKDDESTDFDPKKIEKDNLKESKEEEKKDGELDELDTALDL